MVDIFIGAAIPPVMNNPNNRENQRRRALKKKMRKEEKRRNRQDRRQDVRSGVTVTLSKYPDRRRAPDRRKGDS